MTTDSRRADARQAALMSSSRVEQEGNIVVKWITSTDHKTIGYMYLIASVLFFLLGGVMALVIRAELFAPGMQIVPTKEQYNQLFTMHGTIMLLMFATPLFAGFANAILPLQIGAPDVAFPRLNAFWDHGQESAAGARERPVGLRRLTRMGDVVPAATAQLHLDPAHPQRAPGLRPEPRGRRRGPRRAARPTRPRHTGRVSRDPILFIEPLAADCGPTGALRLARPALLCAPTHPRIGCGARLRP